MCAFDPQLGMLVMIVFRLWLAHWEDRLLGVCWGEDQRCHWLLMWWAQSNLDSHVEIQAERRNVRAVLSLHDSLLSHREKCCAERTFGRHWTARNLSEQC